MKLGLLSFFILTVISSFAQNKAGLNSGVNFTVINLENEKDASQEGKLGFYIGVWKGFELSDKASLRPEFIFSLQRSRFMRQFTFTPGDFSVSLGVQNSDGTFHDLTNVDVNINEYVLQLPVIFEYLIRKKVYLGVGPQLGYVLIENTTNNDDGTYDFGELDDYRFGLSYIASLGYKFDDWNSIRIRYVNRISIRNALKNRVFQIGFYHSF